jgi:hypothetical protein
MPIVVLLFAVSAAAGTKAKPFVLQKGWTGTIHYAQHENDGAGNSVSLDVTFTIVGHSPRYFTDAGGGGHPLYWVKATGAVTVIAPGSPYFPCPTRTVTASWSGSYSRPRTAYTTAGVWIWGQIKSPLSLRVDSIENLPFAWTETDCNGTRKLDQSGGDITTTHFLRAPHKTGAATIDAWDATFQNGDGTYKWNLKWCSAPAKARRCSR